MKLIPISNAVWIREEMIQKVFIGNNYRIEVSTADRKIYYISELEDIKRFLRAVDIRPDIAFDAVHFDTLKPSDSFLEFGSWCDADVRRPYHKPDDIVIKYDQKRRSQAAQAVIP